jgi:hypothetical protein
MYVVYTISLCNVGMKNINTYLLSVPLSVNKSLNPRFIIRMCARSTPVTRHLHSATCYVSRHHTYRDAEAVIDGETTNSVFTRNTSIFCRAPSIVRHCTINTILKTIGKYRYKQPYELKPNTTFYDELSPGLF